MHRIIDFDIVNNRFRTDVDVDCAKLGIDEANKRLTLDLEFTHRIRPEEEAFGPTEPESEEDKLNRLIQQSLNNVDDDEDYDDEEKSEPYRYKEYRVMSTDLIQEVCIFSVKNKYEDGILTFFVKVNDDSNFSFEFRDGAKARKCFEELEKFV